MKRLILAAGAVVAAAAPAGAMAAILDGPAPGKAPTPAHARAYERAYATVARERGRRAPGRNIVKAGIAPGWPATDAEVVASLAVLDRMLGSGQSPTTSPASSSVASAGASGVPACASESGTNYSTGPANTNPSSGATGRYQILPSTAAAYGCNLSTPAGQDACAQVIYARQGASAWVNCGG